MKPGESIDLGIDAALLLHDNLTGLAPNGGRFGHVMGRLKVDHPSRRIEALILKEVIADGPRFPWAMGAAGEGLRHVLLQCGPTPWSSRAEGVGLNE